MNEKTDFRDKYYQMQKIVRCMMIQIQICFLASVFVVLFFITLKSFAGNTSPYWLLYLVENSPALCVISLILPIALLLRKNAGKFGLHRNLFFDCQDRKKSHQRKEQSGKRIGKYVIIIFYLILIIFFKYIPDLYFLIFLLLQYIIVITYAFYGKTEG